MSTELVHLRTQNSKTFDLGSGQFKADHSIAPLHWLDPVTGQWNEIDSTLDETGNPKSTIFNLDLHDIGYTFRHKHGGQCTVTLVRAGDRTDLNTSNRTISGNVVTWHDVLPSLDVSLIVRPQSVQFVETLKDKSAPTTFVFRHVDSKHENVKVLTEAFGHDAAMNEAETTTTVSEGVSEYDVTVSFTGRVKVTDPKTRRKSWGEPVYPVAIDPTVTSNITNGNDDVLDIGNVYYANAIPFLDFFGYQGKSHTNVGFRFTLSVPQGASISSATLNLWIPTAMTSGIAAGRFYATNSNNAAAWVRGGGGYRPGTAPRTAHSTSVTITSSTPTGAYTINVTSAVQDTINRSGWVSGNHISLIGIDNGTSTNAVGFSDYSRVDGHAAMLSVTYTTGLGLDDEAFPMAQGAFDDTGFGIGA